MDAETKIPQHVAIIMDGNGRWARERGLERVEGHIKGVESVRTAIESAVRHKVRILTLYVFSTENWGRPDHEVGALMELLCKCVVEECDNLVEQGVRVVVAGDRQGMPQHVLDHIELIEERTAQGGNLTVLLALNYGSRQEIARAARLLAAKVAAGTLAVEDITPETLAAGLYTAGYPDPDLLIRTGGDLRISNFLLWQAAYSELYFIPEYWPDFTARSFELALSAYAERERRFGLVTR